MAFPEDEADLKELLSFAHSKRFPVTILGGGTNLLVRDGGIKGIVVNLKGGLRDVDFSGSADGHITAGSGVILATLISECKERGLAGLEFATGIPGSLGGAVAMNAGAYNGEMADVVEGVELLDKKGKKGFLTASEINFGYRESKLPEDSVVVRVRLKLAPGETKDIEERIEDIKKKRKAKEPLKGRTAGCVFKNPAEGDSAGKLIDDAGLKGEVSGGAMISSEHANYIVNTNGATARDVLALMALVRDNIFSANGVTLEPEIKVIGND
jgi:UDP-N-acetylmuramate dehydrogenase